MALITNGQDIQNAIYGVLKQDGYLSFLGSGGQEIARVKDEAVGEGLPYKLNLTDSGRINLKDAGGNVLSYVQQFSATEQAILRKGLVWDHLHSECFPVRFINGRWDDYYTPKKKYLDGGFGASVRSELSSDSAIGIRISKGIHATIPVNATLRVQFSLVDCSDGKCVGNASQARTCSAAKIYDSVITKTEDSQTLDFVLDGMTESERGIVPLGILIDIFGEAV